MVRTENECVDCGLPCIHERCRYYRVTRFYCDNCNEEFDPDELYLHDDQMLCKECLVECFQTVADSID